MNSTFGTLEKLYLMVGGIDWNGWTTAEKRNFLTSMSAKDVDYFDSEILRLVRIGRKHEWNEATHV